MRTERQHMWRGNTWQPAGRAVSRRWPIQLSIAVVLSMCVAAWIVLASVLHIFFGVFS